MISIVILTHNRLQSLKKCIDSILITNNNNIEIIVVNNASTDGTTEWLDSIKYNVKHIKMDSNIGVIARNEGIYQAKGDIIFQVDDDCTVDPGFYNIITSNMQDDKIGAIGQDASNFNGWLSFDRNVRQGEYCDFVTGYLWAFRHNNWTYDIDMGHFWREESVSGSRYTPCLINNRIKFLSIEELFNMGDIVKYKNKCISKIKNVKVLSTNGNKNKKIILKYNEKKSLDGSYYKIGVRSLGIRSKIYQQNILIGDWKKLDNVVRFDTKYNKKLVIVNQKYGESIVTLDHSLISKNLKCITPEKLDKTEWANIRKIPKTLIIDKIDLWNEIDDKSDLIVDDKYIYYKTKIKHNNNYKSNNRIIRFINKSKIKKFLNLLASYISEGSVSIHQRNKSITNSYNWKICNSDKAWIKELQDCYSDLFLKKCNINKSKSVKNRKIIWYMGGSEYLTALILYKLCGKGSSYKYFPNFIFNLNNNYKKYFFKQLVKGDGHILNVELDSYKSSRKLKSYASQSYRYCTNSTKLVSQLSFLLVQLNKFFNIRKIYHSKKNPKWKDSYEIAIRTHYLSNDIKTTITNTKNERYVYDLDVRDSDYFVDGCGLVLLHNTDLQLNISNDRFKILKCQKLGLHASRRTELDIALLTKNTHYLVKKWKSIIDKKFKDGIQVFTNVSVDDYMTKYYNQKDIIIG